MRTRPQVTLWLVNPESAWPWVEVRGVVEGISEKGADAHIDSLSKKYMGVDSYPVRRSNGTRVMFKIKPTRVKVVTLE